MRNLFFSPSSEMTLGIELELQLIDPDSFDLASKAKEVMRAIKKSPNNATIKPEAIQAMIEINSSIHHDPNTLYAEMIEMRNFLIQQGEALGVKFCGGGTHPFQVWWDGRKIFPTLRYRNLSRTYSYLMKRGTVFGQHVHIGCCDGNEAIYLIHGLSRYIPQFIALSASSPFYQGIDTDFFSTRLNTLTDFPLSGVMPYLLNWKEFSEYFFKMQELGVVTSIKDFYWDIRPKPEFGTVEIRVFDTPLTVKMAVAIAAYVQVIAEYLSKEKPITITHDIYDLYNYNRFQAVRFGYHGTFIDPQTFNKTTISADILDTIKKIQKYVDHHHAKKYIVWLASLVENDLNDAAFLRNCYKKNKSLLNIVDEQCRLWEQ